MKVSATNLQMMAEKIETFLSYVYGHDLSKEQLQEFSENEMYHWWNKINANICYCDNNPNVLTADGKRIFEQDPNFDFYVDDTNDITIRTALNYVFKNLIPSVKFKGAKIARIVEPNFNS